jgi:hypothetical protein
VAGGMVLVQVVHDGEVGLGCGGWGGRGRGKGGAQRGEQRFKWWNTVEKLVLEQNTGGVGSTEREEGSSSGSQWGGGGGWFWVWAEAIPPAPGMPPPPQNHTHPQPTLPHPSSPAAPFSSTSLTS